MAPLEGQVKEHHARLRRRLDSMRRISEAKDELEDRVRELEEAHAAAVLQLAGLRRELDAVHVVVHEPEELPFAAKAA
jgi:chromosome segregation ATPase